MESEIKIVSDKKIIKPGEEQMLTSSAIIDQEIKYLLVNVKVDSESERHILEKVFLADNKDTKLSLTNKVRLCEPKRTTI